MIQVHNTMSMSAYCTYYICCPPRGNERVPRDEIYADEATLLACTIFSIIRRALYSMGH